MPNDRFSGFSVDDLLILHRALVNEFVKVAQSVETAQGAPLDLLAYSAKVIRRLEQTIAAKGCKPLVSFEVISSHPLVLRSVTSMMLG